LKKELEKACVYGGGERGMPCPRGSDLGERLTRKMTSGQGGLCKKIAGWRKKWGCKRAARIEVRS